MSDETQHNLDMDIETNADPLNPSTSSASTRPDERTPEKIEELSSDLSDQMSPSELAEHQSYLAQMDKEMKDWAEISMQRKRALRLAKREMKSKPLEITFESVAETLGEERRNFLLARPDYKGLLAFAQDTLVATEIANQKSQLAALRMQSAVDLAQGVIHDVTNKIIKRQDPIIDG